MTTWGSQQKKRRKIFSAMEVNFVLCFFEVLCFRYLCSMCVFLFSVIDGIPANLWLLALNY